MRTSLTGWTQRLLAGLGVVLITAGLIAGVAHREVLDGKRFASHADAVRTDDEVARQLGREISDRVLEAVPDLVAVRPLLESASSAVVASGAWGPLVRSTVQPLHGALVSGEDGSIVLRLADVGALLVAAVTTLAPDAAVAIPDQLDVRLAEIGAGTSTAQVIEAAHLVSELSWLLPVLGALCWLGAGLLGGGFLQTSAAVTRRGLIAVAGLLGTLTLVGHLLVLSRGTDTLGGAVLRASWDELDGPLWRVVVIVAAAGVALSVLAAAGTPSGRPAALRSRAARALGVAGLGVALILEPLACLKVAVVALGVGLAWFALRDLARLALIAVRRRAPRLVRDLSERARRGAAVAAVAAVLVGVVLAGAWPTSTALPASANDSGRDRGTATCNGHTELCDRRYNEVSFPATHNSMSAADQPGWFLAEQPTGVLGQLDDGIRVFLIDSWPGQATDQPSVVANSEASRASAMKQARAEFGVSLVESALRLRSALHLTPTGPVQPYLCHALCELGSTPWLPLMRQVRAWMAAHPREVVTFFIQDEVSLADTAQVFADAGLSDYLATPAAGEPWPTLGQMIDSGRRLVVLQEHRVDPAYPWMLDGEVWSQDTPYDFSTAAQFSCARYRGSASAPLFLVNHWLNKPARRIAAATQVNARSVLLPRLHQCQAERGQIPTFVAVDYYDRGDLFEVVDELNGLTE